MLNTSIFSLGSYRIFRLLKPRYLGFIFTSLTSSIFMSSGSLPRNIFMMESILDLGIALSGFILGLDTIGSMPIYGTFSRSKGRMKIDPGVYALF